MGRSLAGKAFLEEIGIEQFQGAMEGGGAGVCTPRICWVNYHHSRCPGNVRRPRVDAELEKLSIGSESRDYHWLLTLKLIRG